MKPEIVIFYIVSSFIVGLAFLTVFSRRIFRAAVFLLFCLLGIAAIYFMLDADFLAALQIVIYVGGIVVLVIFSIFLTHQSGEKMPRAKIRRWIPAVLLSLISMFAILLVVFTSGFKRSEQVWQVLSVKEIGHQLFDFTNHGYVFPFEIASILLLSALIGCIVIAIQIRKSN